MYAKITGTGSYLPPMTLTNDMLSEMVTTSDSWIKERTGIETRRIETEGFTWEMGVKAAQKALQNAKITAADIDLIIGTTVTPDYFTPSLSCLVQGGISASGAVAFDVSAACSGFVYALDVADCYIKTGRAKKILIVSSERLSAITDYTDRTTCVLFGDAAAAAVVEASETPGILSTVLSADGANGDVLMIPALTKGNPFEKKQKPGYLSMNGKAVFRFAVGAVSDAIGKALAKAHLEAESIDWVLMHQANARIISSVVERMGFNTEKVPVNIARFGNTSSASIPLLLHELREQGKVKAGDTAVLTGFGGGLTYAAAVVTM